jgi:hypothetical protein
MHNLFFGLMRPFIQFCLRVVVVLLSLALRLACEIV